MQSTQPSIQSHPHTPPPSQVNRSHVFGIDASELLIYPPIVHFYNRFGRSCSAEEAGYEPYKWWEEGMRGGDGVLDFGERCWGGVVGVVWDGDGVV